MADERFGAFDFQLALWRSPQAAVQKLTGPGARDEVNLCGLKPRKIQPALTTPWLHWLRIFSLMRAVGAAWGSKPGFSYQAF